MNRRWQGRREKGKLTGRPNRNQTVFVVIIITLRLNGPDTPKTLRLRLN